MRPRWWRGAAAHARLVTSAPDPVAPVQAQIDAALLALCEAAEALGGGGRLYVYLAGHGAMSIASGDDVALLLAAWSHADARIALSCNAYRGALSSLGVFRELALFLDCCRSTAAGAVGVGPSFALALREPGRARAFVAYATEAGSAAHEAPAGANGWQGVFTRQLLALLARGVEASQLKHLLEHTARVTGQRAHVIDGLATSSRFGNSAALPLLEVIPDDEAQTLELYDGKLQRIAVHAIRDGVWSKPLPAGLYKLRCGSRSELIDHETATLIDLRPRLAHPFVRVWRAGDNDARPDFGTLREIPLGCDAIELVEGVAVVPDGPGYRLTSRSPETGSVLRHRRHRPAARSRALPDRRRTLGRRVPRDIRARPWATPAPAARARPSARTSENRASGSTRPGAGTLAGGRAGVACELSPGRYLLRHARSWRSPSHPCRACGGDHRASADLARTARRRRRPGLGHRAILLDLTGLDPDAPLAQAACRATGDPRWASWHPGPGATAWIAPTLAALPPGDPVALGRRLAIPPACVARAQRR